MPRSGLQGTLTLKADFKIVKRDLESNVITGPNALTVDIKMYHSTIKMKPEEVYFHIRCPLRKH